MRILVIFGSQSDANIFEPLKARLMADGHEIDFRMISAHRSPGLLDQELKDLHVDAIVAGAGLAAHLPGVLASKTLIPVIGIPCSAALGGLDATCAILQMPFGIPVLTTAPDAFSDALNFLKNWESLDRILDVGKICVVLDKSKRSLPHIESLLERVQKIAGKIGYEIPVLAQSQEHMINICMVEIDPSSPGLPLSYGPAMPNEIRIYVPVLDPSAYRDARSAFLVLEKMQSMRDGLWVGINNTGNGILSALQLYNRDGKFGAFLTHAKKGYIHH